MEHFVRLPYSDPISTFRSKTVNIIEQFFTIGLIIAI